MHLKFASRRRLLAKQLWYCLHERIMYPQKPVETIAQLYGMAPNWDGASFSKAPGAWWEPYADIMKYLEIDADPWQELECQRLAASKPNLLDGLDTFGVI